MATTLDATLDTMLTYAIYMYFGYFPPSPVMALFSITTRHLIVGARITIAEMLGKLLPQPNSIP